MSEAPRDFGTQPLDLLLEEKGLANRDLVDASTEQLTFKQVQKARRGRRVTLNIQQKIRNAVENALKNRGEDVRVDRKDLFTYEP